MLLAHAHDMKYNAAKFNGQRKPTGTFSLIVELSYGVSLIGFSRAAADKACFDAYFKMSLSRFDAVSYAVMTGRVSACRRHSTKARRSRLFSSASHVVFKCRVTSYSIRAFDGSSRLLSMALFNISL